MFGQDPGGPLVRGGQLAAVLVPAVAQVLHLLVLVLREDGAVPRLGGGDLQPVHLLLRGRAAAARRADLLAQPGHPAGPGGCAARCCVLRSRSVSEDSANQVSCARASTAEACCAAWSSSFSLALAWASSCSRTARLASTAASSASSRCRSAASVT